MRENQEILVSPVPYWVILLGYVSGGVVRGFVVGMGVFFTVSFFVDFDWWSSTQIINQHQQ
jgi:ABC-2 type transport system permease protein